MSADPLEPLLSELFAAPLDAFTKTRNALAARLTKTDKAAAAKLKSTQKPTASAWVVNQVARAAPDGLQTLFDAVDALASAQIHGADAGAMKELQSAEKAAVAALIDVARRVSAPTPAVMDRAERNLRWGALSLEWRAQILAGRLQTDVPAQDFAALLSHVPEGGLLGATISGKTRPAPTHTPAAVDDTDTRLVRRRAEMRVQTARAELKHAQAEADRADADVARAAAARERAAAAVEDLRRRLEDAEARLTEAEHAETDLRVAADARRTHAKTAARRLAEAERDLPD